MDKSPAFKFYKKRVILAEPGQVYCLMVATGDIVAFLSDSPKEREGQLSDVLEAFSANTPFISNPTEGNWCLFTHGHMSRSTGYLNSCPATNPGFFNLDKKALDWSVADVIGRLPNFVKKLVSDKEVIAALRKHFEADESVRFAEPALTGPGATNGCTKIEAEIFDKNLPVRAAAGPVMDKVGKSGQILPNAINSADAEKYLSPFQYKKYLSCARLGLKEKLVEYNSIIIAAKAKEVEGVSKVIQGDADQIQAAPQPDPVPVKPPAKPRKPRSGKSKAAQSDPPPTDEITQNTPAEGSVPEML